MENPKEDDIELEVANNQKSTDELLIKADGSATLTSSEVKGTILKMLDKSRKQKFQITTILISGIGFFTDSYDLFVIGLIVPILQDLYYDGKMPALDKSFLTASSLVGTLLGQLLFGYLGDKLGRKKVYGITLIIMSVCAIGSAFSFTTPSMSIVASLSIWRIMLGIGIGGEYPLSAVLTSEYANVSNRGSQIAAVFAMQGFGQLFGAAVVLILLEIFPSDDYLDYVWRLALAIGVIPAMITAYFRFQIPETPRFLMDVKEDYKETIEAYNQLKKTQYIHATELNPDKVIIKETQKDKDKHKTTFWQMFKIHYPLLIGTGLTWFLVDIAFYSQSLFQPTILQSISFFDSTTNMVTNIRALALGSFCIALLGAIPGYWMTVLFVDRMGRRNIQLMGFALMCILYLILCTSYTELVAKAPAAYIILYALTFFFTNFGPNSTTFIIPSELFPTAFRSTAHGISAACGKSGAILGTFGFAPLSSAYGLPACLAVFTVLLFIGFFITWFFTPETAQKTLEELEYAKAPINKESEYHDMIRFRSCKCVCWLKPRDADSMDNEKMPDGDVNN
jgi:PHS family inorganic phosphate transporter-like MFS transporter